MPLWIQNKNNNSTFQYKYLSAYNFKIFLLHLFSDPSQKSILNFDITPGKRPNMLEKIYIQIYE